MTVRRLIDSNILVYSLIKNHPAFTDCSSYLQKFDSEQTLFCLVDNLSELYHIMRVFYQIDQSTILTNIHSLIESNITFINLSTEQIQKSVELAITSQLDLNDCKMIHIAQILQIPIIVTDDKKFSNYVTSNGFLSETPIQGETRKKMDLWEKNTIPSKGLARIGE